MPVIQISIQVQRCISTCVLEFIAFDLVAPAHKAAQKIISMLLNG